MAKPKPAKGHKTLRSKESIVGIRGPTAPQMAREKRAIPIKPVAEVSQKRRNAGPRKKSGAGPMKTRRAKDPSH
jgi:hypothetical protein